MSNFDIVFVLITVLLFCCCITLAYKDGYEQRDKELEDLGNLLFPKNDVVKTCAELHEKLYEQKENNK